jgi:hypothetical protein
VAPSHSYRKWSPFFYERKLILHTLLICPHHTILIQSVAQLSISAHHLFDAVNSSAVEMKSIRIAQANAARETVRLAGTLQRMNATVISALVEINATAIRVNQTIGERLDSFHLNLASLVGATIIYCECEDDRISASSCRQRGDSPLYSKTTLLAPPGRVHSSLAAVVYFTAVIRFPRYGMLPFSAACVQLG